MFKLLTLTRLNYEPHTCEAVCAQMRAAVAPSMQAIISSVWATGLATTRLNEDHTAFYP